MRTKERYYKIGKSYNPQTRLQSIQTGSPFRVKLWRTYEVSNDNKIEQDIHKLLAPARKNGEWFHLYQNGLAKLVDELLKEYQIAFKRIQNTD